MAAVNQNSPPGSASSYRRKVINTRSPVIRGTMAAYVGWQYVGLRTQIIVEVADIEVVDPNPTRAEWPRPACSQATISNVLSSRYHRGYLSFSRAHSTKSPVSFADDNRAAENTSHQENDFWNDPSTNRSLRLRALRISHQTGLPIWMVYYKLKLNGWGEQ